MITRDVTSALPITNSKHFTLCQRYTWLIAINNDDITEWKFGLMVFIEGKMYKKYTELLEKSIVVTLQHWGTKWQRFWEVPWPRHNELVYLRFKQQACRPTPFFHWNVRWRNKSCHCLSLPLMGSVGCRSVCPLASWRYPLTHSYCHNVSSAILLSVYRKMLLLSLLKYVLITEKKMSAVIFS